jgi:hypothetical protein
MESKGLEVLPNETMWRTRSGSRCRATVLAVGAHANDASVVSLKQGRNSFVSFKFHEAQDRVADVSEHLIPSTPDWSILPLNNTALRTSRDQSEPP